MSEEDPVPDEDAELVPETPRAVPIRDCLALVGPELVPDPSYPIGQFELPSEGASDSISIAVAAVAEVEGRVVVAVPFAAWHRTVARRVLPSSALQKPLPLTVDLVDRSLPEGAEASHFETAKVWFGVLATGFEGAVIYDPEASEVSPDFQFSSTDPALTPSVEGLTQAFQQHFAFVSAASGGSGTEPRGPKSFDPKQFDHRLQCLEKSIESIAENLGRLNLPSGATAAVPLPSRPCQTSAAAAPTVQPVAPPTTTPAAQLSAGGGHVDSDVVQSARLAGVPEHQIQEMLKLALRGRSRLGDVPIQTRQSRAKRSTNVLSESEEEEEPPIAPGVGSPEGDPIVTALQQTYRDCQSADFGEEERQDIRCTARRRWLGRIFRERINIIHSEILCGATSSSQCPFQTARRSFKDHREEHAGRFLQGLPASGVDSSPGERKGLVGTPVTCPGVPDSGPVPLGRGRSSRLIDQRSWRWETRWPSTVVRGLWPPKLLSRIRLRWRHSTVTRRRRRRNLRTPS